MSRPLRFLTPLFILFLAPALSAQRTHAQITEYAKVKYLDKIRHARAAQRDDPNTANLDNSQSTAGGREIAVSASTDVESEITATVNPRDPQKMVVAAIGPTLLAGITDPSIPIYFSSNGGEDWERSAFRPSMDFDLLEFISVFGGDPVLAYDDNGWVHLTWLSGRLALLPESSIKSRFYHAISRDDGKTWERTEAPVIERSSTASADLTSLTGRVVDKEWLVADHGPNSPYRGAVYIFYTEVVFEKVDTVLYNAYVQEWEATTGWSEARLVISSDDLPFNQSISPTVLPNGDIHVAVMGASFEDEFTALYHVRSTDGGRAFSQPRRIAYFNISCFQGDVNLPSCIEGVQAQRVAPNATIHHHPNNGELYTIWSADGEREQATEGVDVFLAASRDDGVTWSPPKRVNQDQGSTVHNWMPTGVMSPAGDFYITWYDKRRGSQHTDYYGIRYDPIAEIFGPEFVISGEPTDFSQIGSGNEGFGVGDYNQTLFVDGHLLPFWADGRTRDGNINLYMAKIARDSGVVKVSPLNKAAVSLTLTPNPATTTLRITLDSERAALNGTVSILNATGERLLEWPLSRALLGGRQSFTVPIGSLPAGAYFILFNPTESGPITRRFLKTGN